MVMKLTFESKSAMMLEEPLLDNLLEDLVYQSGKRRDRLTMEKQIELQFNSS